MRKLSTMCIPDPSHIGFKRFVRQFGSIIPLSRKIFGRSKMYSNRITSKVDIRHYIEDVEKISDYSCIVDGNSIFYYRAKYSRNFDKEDFDITIGGNE